MTTQEVKNNFVQNLAENAYINMCSAEEMKIAIEALEKQIPKKLKIREKLDPSGQYERFCCPCCYKWQYTKVDGRIVTGIMSTYCPNCGQALDFRLE